MNEVRQRFFVFSKDWKQNDQDFEEIFVVRSWLGALSRFADLDILTPGNPRSQYPDGLFDLYTIGSDASGGGWPVSLDLDSLPHPGASYAFMRSNDLGAHRLWEQLQPDGRTLGWSTTASIDISSDVTLTVTRGQRDAIVRQLGATDVRRGDPDLKNPGVVATGLYIPINELSAAQRHNGLGFTDYLIVLTDRPGTNRRDSPPDSAAWIAARFPREYLVVVEAGEASVWHERSLRGSIRVDTRADLWRLIAHARATIDLRPDPHVARECVESMRYGVPTVVPASTVAAEHVTDGGGMTYRSIAELFECIEALLDPELKVDLGHQAREIADRRFGDPTRFAEAVRSAVEQPGKDPASSRDNTKGHHGRKSRSQAN
ncbi:MAG: glycosyltransferase [Acidimicrobiales bacterium]